MQLATQDNIVELKAFAKTMIWAFPVVFCVLLPWLFNYAVHWWPLAVSATLAVLYVSKPSFIYYPYRLWMGIALALGWINTRIILTLVFFTLIMPFGLALRALKKLQYTSRPNRDAKSFYQPCEPKPDIKRLESPF